MIIFNHQIGYIQHQ